MDPTGCSSPHPPCSKNLERVDTTRPVKPGIACVVQTASRQPRTANSQAAPGGLYTLIGNQIGPVDQVSAVLDGSGSLPLNLSRIEVLINQTPAPLISVQQGLITFYIS